MNDQNNSLGWAIVLSYQGGDLGCSVFSARTSGLSSDQGIVTAVSQVL